MVTILYVGSLVMVMVLMGWIDTFIYGDSIIRNIYFFLHYDPGTRKFFMYISIIIGLIHCMIIDRKMKKEK